MRRTLIGGVLALTAMLATAGCGGSGGASRVAVGPDLLANVYKTSKAANSAEVRMTVRITTATGATSTIVANGGLQWQPVAAYLTTSLGGIGAGSLTLGERILGSELYIEMPAQYAADLGGKRWLKASLSQLVGTNAINSYDPTQILGVLSAQASSVVRVGVGSLDGVPTTHYRAIIDMKRETTTPLLRQMFPKLEAVMGTTELPIDVWVDSSGRLAELQMKVTVRRPPTGSSGASAAASDYPITEVTAEHLSDYGTAVNVSVPPASEVSSFNLARVLQSSGL